MEDRGIHGPRVIATRGLAFKRRNERPRSALRNRKEVPQRHLTGALGAE